MSNKIYIHILSTFAAILLSGCVREDVPPCDYGADVAFRYVLNSTGNDQFTTEVHKITLFVFDAEGIYLDSYIDQGAALEDPAYTMHLPLEPGTYTLVAWGGYLNTYTVEGLVRGTSTLEDFRLEANGIPSRAGNPVEITSLDELFHGLCREFTVTADDTAKTTIDLVKDTNTILVNVTGLEYLPESLSTSAPASPLDVWMAADNGTYLFDNSIASGNSSISYLPLTNVNENYTIASTSRMLRLILGRNINLKIRVGQSGMMLGNDNIMDLITSNPAYATQEDIDRTDVYRFDYEIHSNATITLQVNGWKVREAIPII